MSERVGQSDLLFVRLTRLILTQAWLFISPGLYPRERRYAIPFVLSASLLFITGGAFGYYVAFPMAMQFLLDWIVESRLTPIIDAVEYSTCSSASLWR